MTSNHSHSESPSTPRELATLVHEVGSAAGTIADRGERLCVAYRALFGWCFSPEGVAPRDASARQLAALQRVDPLTASSVLRRVAEHVDPAVEAASLGAWGRSVQFVSDAEGRQERGVYHTPAWFADEVAAHVVSLAAAGSASSGTVLDPACGGGALLAAVRRHRDDDVLDRLYGVDIDPVAIEVARCRLLAEAGRLHATPNALNTRIVVGDSLRMAWSERFADVHAQGGFDAVIANPPFGNAIEKKTARSDDEKEAYAARFPHAARGAYDRAGLFVELAIQLTRPGAPVGVIVPRALLAAPYAQKLRAWATEERGLAALLVTDDHRHFDDADVYVRAVLLGGAGPPVRVRVDTSGPQESIAMDGVPRNRWSVLDSPFAPCIAAIPDDWRPLSSFVDIRASAATGEAYELAPSLTETPTPGEETARFVTSGAIDPFALRWDAMTIRYLKKDYERPYLPLHAVSERRQTLYRSPKVLVPGLSRVLEAAADTDGTYAGAVATLSVRPLDPYAHTPLLRIAAMLNSDIVRAQFLALYGSQALGGGSVQVTKKKLGEVRVPPMWFAAGAPDGEDSGGLPDVEGPSSTKEMPDPERVVVRGQPVDAQVAAKQLGALDRALAQVVSAERKIALGNAVLEGIAGM